MAQTQPNGFTDIIGAQIALRQQLQAGSINPATGKPINEADIHNELQRLRAANLAQAERNLQAQGLDGGIIAGEMQRLSALNIDDLAKATAPTPQQAGAPVNPPTPSNVPQNGELPYGPPSRAPNVSVAPPDPGFGSQLGPITDQIAGKDPRTAAGFRGGIDLAREFFSAGSLGRVNDQLTPDQAELLTRTRANAFGRTPEIQRSIDNAGALSELAGRRDPLTDRAVSAVGGSVGARDALSARLLQQAESGLGGFSTPELQGLRESGSQAINRNFQTGLESLGIRQASGGVTGGAQTRAALPLARQFQDARGALERNIMLDDVALRDSRRRALEGFSEGVNAREFGEDTSALGLGTGLSASENRSRLEAGGLQGDLALRTGGFELDKLSNAQAYQGTVSQDLLGRSLYNLGNLGTEKQAQLGAILGLGSFGASQDTFNDIMALGREQIEAAKKLKKGTSVSFSALPSASSVGVSPGFLPDPSIFRNGAGFMPGVTYAGLVKNSLSGHGSVAYGNPETHQILQGLPR